MAKRLNPIDRYVKACAWCGKPFVQKDPEYPYCCKTHEIYARRGKLKPQIDRPEPLYDYIRRPPSDEQRIPESVPEPENLSGLLLLAWRMEQRAKNNPNG